MGFSIEWAPSLGIRQQVSADQSDLRYINECLKIVPSNHTNKKIMNLSNVTLNPTIEKILSKGLNFIPTNDKNIKQVIIDLIKIVPVIHNQHIIDITNNRMNIHKPQNISKSDIKVFNEFLNEYAGQIVITKPDKSDTIVVMDLENYFLMGRDIIYRFNYVRISPENIDNLLTNLRILQFNTVKHFNESLNLGSRDKVNIYNNLNFRYMYLLPKIHKDQSSWINEKTPPGRPIVSCCGAMFKSLETYIAKFLDTIIWKNKHWIRSASELTTILVRKNFQLEDYELFVADIKELYLNINIVILRDKINAFLARHGHTDSAIYADAIYTDLSNIYFLFNENLYRMNNGILMGAPFSPALAYIYLHEMDDQLLMNPDILFYTRYIDDLFIIRKINTSFDMTLLEPYNLQLGEYSSGKSVTFLDLKIWICPTSHTIQYGTFFKPTNNFNYIRWDSEHPQSNKKGIVISQLLRIHRTNSNTKIKMILFEMLIRKFINLGYGTNLLKKLKNKVKLIMETSTCKNRTVQKKWSHIITNNRFDNIMTDINNLGYSEENKPNISTYNARNIQKLLKMTNPATLAISRRKRFYKPPFGIETDIFPYDNPFFWRNHWPKVTCDDPKRKIRKITTTEEKRRLETILEVLEQRYNIRLH